MDTVASVWVLAAILFAAFAAGQNSLFKMSPSIIEKHGMKQNFVESGFQGPQFLFPAIVVVLTLKFIERSRDLKLALNVKKFRQSIRFPSR